MSVSKPDSTMSELYDGTNTPHKFAVLFRVCKHDASKSHVLIPHRIVCVAFSENGSGAGLPIGRGTRSKNGLAPASTEDMLSKWCHGMCHKKC